MPDQNDVPYVLGLDIGANSIGWAALGLDRQRHPERIIRTGVRVFEAGVEGDISSGRDESKGQSRRDARALRRRISRRVMRLKALFSLLQKNGLLPDGAGQSAMNRHQTLMELDLRLARNLFPGRNKPSLVMLPYLLRAQALDRPLESWELGRALYHLAQRRGFKSNRLAPARKDEDKGKVKPAIEGLQREIEDSFSRTLGEYFSRLDPEERRIRNRYTSRAMYEHEFEMIWRAQEAHHPDILTGQLKKGLGNIIFHQRPLKKNKHLIGRCRHEPKRRRAPAAILDAQRCRILQQINNLRVFSPEGEILELDQEQRRKLAAALSVKEKLTFRQVGKLLGYSAGHRFNLEEGGESRMLGNRTAAALIAVFGEEKWNSFNSEQQDGLVEDLLSFEKEDACARRAVRVWGLTEDQAREFAALRLEPGYAALSRQALLKILPHLEDGLTYTESVTKVYGTPPPPAARELVPPVRELLPELRNPAVSRALSEVRKVANALVKAYGRPEKIYIELARDLKRPRKERARLSARNRANQKVREEAAKTIMQESGLPRATRDDIEKYRLAVECGWMCPYTGKQFGMNDLFGPSPTVEVEHIIPFSRSLDNSFFNKTLCLVEENRSKRNRTPWEAYASSQERYEEIIDRVKRFQGDAAAEKLVRFRLEDVESIDDYASRQLNDTRYASREAVRFLSVLYGPEETLPVRVGRGQITAYLRSAWNLNSILGDGGLKSRDDHRHHAVDAVAIALTEPRIVNALSAAAAMGPSAHRRPFADFPEPWPGFLDETRASIDSILVSAKPNLKVKGPLHEETNYAVRNEPASGAPVVHVRKALDSLSVPEIESIVDEAVRRAVKDKLEAAGEADPKRFFREDKNLPRLNSRKGRGPLVRRVRIRKSEKTFPVGQDHRQRNVVSKANHHMEIIETKDSQGRIRWSGRLVSLFEAHRRLRLKQPVVDRTTDPDERFLFSLSTGDTIEMDDTSGRKAFFIVRSIWEGRLAYARLSDARKIDDIKKAKEWSKPSIATLKNRNCRKVVITPLGEVRPAHD